jgi:hypothetical protein
MKALFYAIAPLALILRGTCAVATLSELDTAEQATQAPAIGFQLSPTAGAAAANRLLSALLGKGGRMETGATANLDSRFAALALLARDDAFVSQPLSITQGRKQPGLLSSDLSWTPAARLYSASEEREFPYINPLVWGEPFDPAWKLAFSYSSLTSHEQPLSGFEQPRL